MYRKRFSDYHRPGRGRGCLLSVRAEATAYTWLGATSSDLETMLGNWGAVAFPEMPIPTRPQSPRPQSHQSR